MQHRFCGVFKYKKQMYVERHAHTNGPRCAVFPPKPLYRGLTLEQLAAEVERALNEYTLLGRPICPAEWQERENQALAFFGEKSIDAMQRKVKDITIRHDVDQRIYSLFDGRSGKLLGEFDSPLKAASAIYERIGEPTTDPPGVGDLMA